jgi:nucleotide-binding universal stress UspA family protein
LPLAKSLATTWHASLLLVQAVPHLSVQIAPVFPAMLPAYDASADLKRARDYLKDCALHIPGDVRVDAVQGPPVTRALIQAAEEHQVTDIVMTSHGRTGLSRAVLGSVADTLVQCLHCPIIVIPAWALDRQVHQHPVPSKVPTAIR